MSQLPSAQPDWIALSPSMSTAAAVSTSLTIPNPATQTPPIKMSGNLMFIGILTAQTVAFWMRTDGAAAVAGACTLMNPGDFRLVYGHKNLELIRVIQNAAGGNFVAEFYFARSGTV